MTITHVCDEIMEVFYMTGFADILKATPHNYCRAIAPQIFRQIVQLAVFGGSEAYSSRKLVSADRLVCR